MRVHTPPEAVFLLADKQPYLREYRCNSCGAVVCKIVDRVVMSVDNIGLQPSEGGHFVEVICHVSSCQKLYRLFTLQADVTEFTPRVTVNGVELK